uniref:Ubiquitin-like protease family profile domain-containing protein n=1 Tax=Amphimedon queenslandica TaxID=400682 RepID=A0A1X7UT74_AMPQE
MKLLTTTPLLSIQILHSRSDIGLQDLLCMLLQHCAIEVVKSQKKVGGKDCGLFAIGNATTLCCDKIPGMIVFNQDKMRSHLLECIEKGTFALFPSA